MRCVCGNAQQIFRNAYILVPLVGIEGKYLPLHGSGIYPWCPILQLIQHEEIPTQPGPLFCGQRFYLLMLSHGACCSPTFTRLLDLFLIS